MIIGVTGTIGAGKDTFCEILEKEGFIRLSFSDVLREELKKRDMEVNRKNLQDMGNLLRENEGGGAIAKILLSRVEKGKYYVISGFRNPGEVIEFKNNGKKKFILVGIDAKYEIRLDRVLKRGKDKDPKTEEEFAIIDSRDRGIGEPESGQQNEKCFKMADMFISNNGRIDDLKEKVHKLLEQFDKVK